MGADNQHPQQLASYLLVRPNAQHTLAQIAVHGAIHLGQLGGAVLLDERLGRVLVHWREVLAVPAPVVEQRGHYSHPSRQIFLPGLFSLLATTATAEIKKTHHELLWQVCIFNAVGAPLMC
jgi:hypothetical protein